MEQSGFTPTNPDSIELKPIKDEDIAVLKWDDADAPLPDDEDDRQDMADQAIDKDIGMEEAAAAYSVSLDPPLVDDQQEEEPPPPPNEIVYVDPDYKGTSLSEKLREAFQAAPTSILANEEQVNPFEPVSDHYAETQDWRKSGIKYRLIKGVKNTPTFRVRWQCPKCQDRGNHYVPKGADVVYCYTCKTKLKIEDATKEGFPNRDSFGNFYVATKEKWAHARA